MRFANSSRSTRPAGSAPPRQRRLRSARAGRKGPSWIATLDGKNVGTVAAVDRGDEVYVRSMAVTPGARGAGVAAALLDAVTQFALDVGARRMRLSTTPFLHGAIRLYERAGFERRPGPARPARHSAVCDDQGSAPRSVTEDPQAGMREKSFTFLVTSDASSTIAAVAISRSIAGTVRLRRLVAAQSRA